MAEVEKFGSGAHIITVHEWVAHIFTWECTCWTGIPGDNRGWGNAPYGWEQAQEQIESHLAYHGQAKQKRLAELNKALREATRPLTKRERREKHERERGR